MSKSTTLVESGKGTMHALRRIAAGEPRAMEGNPGPQPPVSYHVEVRTLQAEAYLGKRDIPRHVYSYRCGGGLTVTASKQTPLPVTGTIPLTGPVGYRSAKNLTGYRGLTGGMDGVGRGGDMSRFNYILRNLASFV